MIIVLSRTPRCSSASRDIAYLLVNHRDIGIVVERVADLIVFRVSDSPDERFHQHLHPDGTCVMSAGLQVGSVYPVVWVWASSGLCTYQGILQLDRRADEARVVPPAGKTGSEPV